jgi:uncharacterized protein (DUF1800 family)
MNFRKAARRACVVATAVIAVTAAAGAQRPSTSVPRSPDDRAIVHVLNRLGFGPAPGDVERVRRIGLEAYIDQQLQPSRVADEAVAARLAGFETLAMSSRQIAQDYYLPAQMARRQAQRTAAAAAAAAPKMPDEAMAAPQRPARNPGVPGAMPGERRVMAELTQQKILRAAYSDRQLEEVMVDFWFNHFNVFAGKGQTRIYVTEYERDTIRPHVFGSFRQLLGAVAESPAMLFYLDNWQSVAPDVTGASMRPGRARGRQAVVRPEMPRPPQQNRRRGINENYARELMELHTLGVEGGYSQKDVQEIARAFTGWTIDTPRQGGSFRFNPRAHDDGEKTVLGVRLPRGGGRKDGELVLDILARHPSTARFIATKLARRFVADTPPAALVERASARFLETGGNIREVVRVIVTSPEFFESATYRAKVKTPLEFVASAVRASGVDLQNALPLVQTLRELGMPLYMCQPPTGYADKAEAWVNTGALLNRMNFAVMLSGNRLRGGPGRRETARTDLQQERIVTDILAGDVSETTRQTIARATTEPQKVALLLGSPDFQRR